MEIYHLPEDIKVMYIEAKSFPEGINEAHETLHRLVPGSRERKFFGISRPENGKIVYKAAAGEVQDGESTRLKLKTIILQKGKYISLVIDDYMKDLSQIADAFEELLSHPRLDPQGYCVEWYINDKTLKCMVRLKD